MTHTAKHTPGPWHTDGWENIVVNDQWGTTILCCAGSSTGTLPEIKANAALIAAAPAMYEALKAALDYYRGVFTGNTVTDEMMSSKLEQAIAQAEGTNR